MPDITSCFLLVFVLRCLKSIWIFSTCFVFFAQPGKLGNEMAVTTCRFSSTFTDFLCVWSLEQPREVCISPFPDEEVVIQKVSTTGTKAVYLTTVTLKPQPLIPNPEAWVCTVMVTLPLRRTAPPPSCPADPKRLFFFFFFFLIIYARP